MNCCAKNVVDNQIVLSITMAYYRKSFLSARGFEVKGSQSRILQQ
jgi:hypothetical protein